MQNLGLINGGLLLLCLCLYGCSSVTLRPDGGVKDFSEPSYEDRKSFYLFGLVGEHRVDVNEVCEGAEVEQMQTIASASDYLLGTVTFFIYAPRTVRVWCGQ